MSYHSLSECTLTPRERFLEKNEILKKLSANFDHIRETADINDKEWNFLQKMLHETNVSVRQLFWLRDIAEKYL